MLDSLQEQFLKAKEDECKTWAEKEVYELVDLRKLKETPKNYITSRWVLTVKRDKEGKESAGPVGCCAVSEINKKILSK